MQVHSLLNVVRPDRQTLLFSATLPRKIEALVAEALSNPVRISVGLLGAANADIAQRVEIMKGEDQPPSTCCTRSVFKCAALKATLEVHWSSVWVHSHMACRVTT
jgi:superfamily II DNA/RNA helicase